MFSFYLLLNLSKEKSSVKDQIKDHDLGFDVELLNETIVNALEEEQLFLDAKLNVRLLARAVNSNVKYVSYAINKVHDKNFSNFINDYEIVFEDEISIVGINSNIKNGHATFLFDKQLERFTIGIVQLAERCVVCDYARSHIEGKCYIVE